MNEELQEAKEQLAMVSKAFMEYQNYQKNRSIRGRNIIIAILAALLILSNLAWAIYEHGFESVTETTETVTTTFENIEQNADGGGNNNIVGGDFINGDTKN